MTPLMQRLDAVNPLIFTIAIVLASMFTGCGGPPSAVWQTAVWTGAAVESAD